MKAIPLILAVGSVLAAGAVAGAADTPTVTLTLKDHRFAPSAFTVPAGEKVKVVLVNRDPATEEFDSQDLRIEAIVTPLASVSFTIGPLKAGEYAFMGEFHPATAQGKVTAVQGAPLNLAGRAK